MSLEKLPTELHLEITSGLTYASLSALTRTYKSLHNQISPLLWSHLQFGPPTTAVDIFQERAFPLQPSPPYICPLSAAPTCDCADQCVKYMNERGILTFYSALRRGLVRDEMLALVRSLEVRGGMLAGCFSPPSREYTLGEIYSLRDLEHGEFVFVFRRLLRERMTGLKCIRIVYDRYPDQDHFETELRATQISRNFCQIVGAYAAAHPRVQVKISTTDFALVRSLFGVLKGPPRVTSLKMSIYQRSAMLEKFKECVLPALAANLEQLTLLAGGSQSNRIWEHSSGASSHVAPGVFDDEEFFSNFRFQRLKSVEYSAELFTFGWVPEGVQRLCVRHSGTPHPRWWKSLAKHSLRKLEKLEIWYDCSSPMPSGAESPEEDAEDDETPVDFSICFRDLKALVIAQSPPYTGYITHPQESPPSSATLRESVIRANPQLKEVFLEYASLGTLSALSARGRLRSLTVQSTLYRVFQHPHALQLFPNLRELAWLHICVQDRLGSAFPTAEVLAGLARYCRKLSWIAMEDRRGMEVPELKECCESGLVAPMKQEQYECLSGLCRRSDMPQIWVFRLDVWRERNWELVGG
ncbi:hypothetical protein L873DRAFT_1819846 [Choiromyces venosus 120613-1]|uniref:F-box domain-containing protein n=1 Tax=Choiromyces venosus 120613-1 TaxID=1336337 RepID=A0A3N4JBG6_9PEZI|nr:hypothetical protein L873DRAFT_1819846 [Choiromyces venosus 120613-1]